MISYKISLTNNSYNTNPDVITAWGATDNGTSDFDNFANALSADGPDGVYASKSYTASGNFNVDVTGFSFDAYSCTIASVEAVFQIYLSGILSNDVANVEITVGGTMYPYSITTNELNAFVGVGKAGELTLDISSLKTWAWADFQSGFSIKFITDKINQGDASTIYIDAIGINVNNGNTSDCISTRPYDDNVLIINTPLVDTYDATKLEYVSASIEPDLVASGSLTWNNAMSLTPGETGIITVYFNPLVAAASTINTATVTGATFLDGSAVNDGTDAADVAITNTGSVTGTIWSEGAGGVTTGWDGTTGYEGGSTDLFLPRVTMNLYGCIDDATGNLFTSATIGNTNKTCSFNGGTWTKLDSVETSGTGDYSFDGLFDGYYYAEVDNGTIPGTITQTGDADETSGLCSTCDALWKDPSSNVNAVAEISSGNDFTNISFGYTANPATKGTIWEDSNNNGVQDEGEIGISGVTVELQHAGCTPGVDCPTAITDADGNYVFENLTAGTAYTITASTGSLPAGGTWTETAESDASVNNSISKTLVAGEASANNDFGFNHTGSSTISEAVYSDWNGDGVQDAGENNLVGITVNLYEDTNNDGVINSVTDALVATTTTTATGYSFTNIPAGNYLVEIDETTLPSFTSLTADPDEPGVACTTCDALGSVTTDGTSTYNTIDFGYQPKGGASILSTVWQDLNGDSILLAESIIDSVTVELWADTDGNGIYELAMTTISDVDGNYSFSNLPDGNYQVKVSTIDSDLPKDAFGNLSISTNGSSYNMTISSGDVTSINNIACSNCSDDLDFGFAKLGAIGSTVFSDANGNGAKDWTETGIEGVTVYLCDAAVGTCNSGSALQSTVTDATGAYLFSGLAPGDYTVAVDAATLGAQTADPDRDGETCASTTYPGLPSCDDEMTDITLSYSTNFMGVNFGYQPSGVIGEYIWLDANADGIQDEGEPGIGSVEVALVNVTAVTIDAIFYTAGTYHDTIYTDLDGYYVFSDLPDGTYDITVTTPVDRAITYDADGVASGTTQIVITGGIPTIAGNVCVDCSLDADFGYKLNGTYSLSGSVCIDDGSGDGVCNTGGETMLEGTIVYLYNNGGEFLGETTVDVSGNYTFDNLPDDTYIISVGTTTSPLNLCSTTTAGATTTTSSVYQSVVISGSSSTGNDFGFDYDVDIDFGDLPVSYEVTKLAEGGAYHIVPVTPTLYLGSTVDTEAAPIQNSSATGDATDDGITFNNPETWVEGTNGGSFDATVTGTGWLVAWFDFNKDGDISDVGEMIISQAVTTGTSTFNFDIPVGADLTGTSYSRVRLFETEPPFVQFSYSGEASGGEVEDYSILFSVLPIELTNFYGESDACNVMLNWTTQSEENFSHFELQRGLDIADFETIEEIRGSGGNSTMSYQYYDREALGLNYYRLKIMDNDGSFEYSRIISVTTDCADQQDKPIQLYPNPIVGWGNNILNIKYYNSSVESSEMVITDATGRIIRQIAIDSRMGWNTLQINVADLAEGTYFISQVSVSGKIRTYRFVKVRE